MFWLDEKSGVPVFVIRSLGKDRRERTLHRNMLYPLSFQVWSEHEQHDDVDNESLVGDQLESVDDSLEDQPIQQGPMTHCLYKSLNEGKFVSVRVFLTLINDFAQSNVKIF